VCAACSSSKRSARRCAVERAWHEQRPGPKLTAAERHLISRIFGFFATGDTIVANNLVLNLYQHVNSPEGRLYGVRLRRRQHRSPRGT
jgi:hypothetical protein